MYGLIIAASAATVWSSGAAIVGSLALCLSILGAWLSRSFKQSTKDTVREVIHEEVVPEIASINVKIAQLSNVDQATNERVARLEGQAEGVRDERARIESERKITQLAKDK